MPGRAIKSMPGCIFLESYSIPVKERSKSSAGGAWMSSDSFKADMRLRKFCCISAKNSTAGLALQ